MSLAQFQTAYAKLIRLPEWHRGADYPAFKSQFDLTETESKQLDALAEDRLVVKYGRAMAFVRWETIHRQIPFSKIYADEEAYEFIWRKKFEKNAAEVRFARLGLAFLQFVSTDPEAIDILNQSSPPWIHDIIRFERAQAEVRLENRFFEKKLPEGSLLTSAAVAVNAYDYRISQFIYEATRAGLEDYKNMAPEPGREHILVIPQGPNDQSCRFFEVDSQVADFIAEQLTSPQGEESVPEGYASLVELGVCRPLEKQKV